MAGIKKLLEEMQSKIFEKVENDPHDFRYEKEEEEDIRRKIKYLELHLQDAIDFEETKDEMEANGSLALAYHKLCDYEKAMKFYKQQLKIGKKVDDECNQRRAHCNIGIIYKIRGDLKMAVKHYNKALDISKRRNEIYAVGRMYNNLANLCEMQMDYEGAIKYHELRIEVAKERTDKDGLSKAYASLGCLYHITGRLQKSIDNYEELLSTLRSKLSMYQHSTVLKGGGALAFHHFMVLPKACYVCCESRNLIGQ